ncbi:MAG: hypothetical protein ACLFPL_00055 [Candidatus Nanoarchaeia archaeon]
MKKINTNNNIIVSVLLLIIGIIILSMLYFNSSNINHVNVSGDINCRINESAQMITTQEEFEEKCSALKDNELEINFEENVLISFLISHGGCSNIEKDTIYDLSLKEENQKIMVEVLQKYDSCEGIRIESLDILVDSKYLSYDLELKQSKTQSNILFYFSKFI